MRDEFCAWDIEIAGTLAHPEGITCAATYTSDGKLETWHGPVLALGMYTEVMLPSDLKMMLRYLWDMAERGYPIVSWNGVGFDWRVLSSFLADPEDKKLCAMLALRGIDPAFHFFCDRGFMPGLDKVCKAIGVKGKLAGMDGIQAIKMWKETRISQDLILEYVAQDAIATADVFKVICGAGGVEWITRSGRMRAWRPKDRKFVVAGEALSLAIPDNSWMTDPWPRDRFVGWIAELGML